MRAFAIAIVVAVAVIAPAAPARVAFGQTPTPTPSPTRTPPTAAVRSATATPTSFAPPTPGLPTPTPKLPEEGGPPGGVLGGLLYSDMDGSRSYTTGDGPSSGSIYIEQLDFDNINPMFFAGVSGYGRWEVRGLPDGHYRISWDPPVDPDQLADTIPPAERIFENPGITFPIPEDPDPYVVRPVRFAEIRGANRVLDIDFGAPPRRPAPGPSQRVQPQTAPPSRLPSTGTSANQPKEFAILSLALAGFAALAGGLIVSRRMDRR